MNADGSNVRQLTNTNFSDSNPTWSPDGDLIAFTRNRNGDNEIFVMMADGTNEFSTGQNGEGPRWRN